MSVKRGGVFQLSLAYPPVSIAATAAIPVGGGGALAQAADGATLEVAPLLEKTATLGSPQFDRFVPATVAAAAPASGAAAGGSGSGKADTAAVVAAVVVDAVLLSESAPARTPRSKRYTVGTTLGIQIY